MDPTSTRLLAAAQVFAKYDGALAIYSTASPYIIIYRINGDTGFGARYSDPSTLQTSNSYEGLTADFYNQNVRFSVDNDFVFSGQKTSPYINVWNFTLGSGFGSKLTDPTTLPGGKVTAIATKRTEQGPGSHYLVAGYMNNWISYYVTSAGILHAQIKSAPEFDTYSPSSAQFHPNGTFLFGQSYQRLRAYPWTDSWAATSTRIGTAVSTPSPTPSNFTGDIHPAGSWYITDAGSFKFIVYPFVSSFGAGNNSYSTPASSVNSVKFSPSGLSIVCNSFTFNTLYSNSFNPSTGAIGATISSAVSSLGDTCENSFSKTGDLVAVVGSASPYVEVYRYSDGAGLGTKLSNPASLATAACYSCTFL
jgi:hypothetical protein